MVEAAGAVAASCIGSGAVDPRLEAFGVQLLRQRLDERVMNPSFLMQNRLERGVGEGTVLIQNSSFVMHNSSFSM